MNSLIRRLTSFRRAQTLARSKDLRGDCGQLSGARKVRSYGQRALTQATVGEGNASQHMVDAAGKPIHRKNHQAVCEGHLRWSLFSTLLDWWNSVRPE